MVLRPWRKCFIAEKIPCRGAWSSPKTSEARGRVSKQGGELSLCQPRFCGVWPDQFGHRFPFGFRCLSGIHRRLRLVTWAFSSSLPRSGKRDFPSDVNPRHPTPHASNHPSFQGCPRTGKTHRLATDRIRNLSSRAVERVFVVDTPFSFQLQPLQPPPPSPRESASSAPDSATPPRRSGPTRRGCNFSPTRRVRTDRSITSKSSWIPAGTIPGDYRALLLKQDVSESHHSESVSICEICGQIPVSIHR
jgi:hypothetical protein